MDKEDIERLKKQAERKNISVNQAVQRAIRLQEFIDQEVEKGTDFLISINGKYRKFTN